MSRHHVQNTPWGIIDFDEQTGAGARSAGMALSVATLARGYRGMELPRKSGGFISAVGQTDLGFLEQQDQAIHHRYRNGCCGRHAWAAGRSR